MVLVPLEEEARGLTLSPPSEGGPSKKSARLQHQNLTVLAPGSQTSSLRNWEE